MSGEKDEPKIPDVKDDIAAMLASLSGASDGPKTKVKDEEKVEGDDAGKDEKEPAEEKVEEQKVEEEKKDEPVIEAKEEPPVDDKDKIIADLRAKLAEKETKPEPKPEPTPPKVEEPKLDDQDFVGETDLDELTRDKDTFNKLLNSIYKKAVADTTATLSKTIPDLVKTNVSVVQQLQETSKQFYTDNPDLANFKKVVATVFEELAAAAPSKTYSELMTAVGPEVRKRLELPAKAPAKAEPKDEPKKNGPPKLPSKGAKSGRPSDKPVLDALQGELEEMNKVVRG